MSEITNDTKSTGSSKNAPAASPAAPPAGNGPKRGGGIFRVWPNGELSVGYLVEGAHKSRKFLANDIVRLAKEPEVWKDLGADVASVTKALKPYIDDGVLIPISDQMATAIEAESAAAAASSDDES